MDGCLGCAAFRAISMYGTAQVRKRIAMRLRDSRHHLLLALLLVRYARGIRPESIHQTPSKAAQLMMLPWQYQGAHDLELFLQ